MVEASVSDEPQVEVVFRSGCYRTIEIFPDKGQVGLRYGVPCVSHYQSWNLFLHYVDDVPTLKRVYIVHFP